MTFINYHLVMTNIAMERSTMLLIGKPSISGPFSMAMLNNQMVINDQFELLANNEINHLKRIRSYISY